MLGLNIRKIDKYRLGQFSFSKKDVLTEQSLRFKRRQGLMEGLALGSQKGESVKINFVSADGQPLSTEAIVWAVNHRNVLLKSSPKIPITSITSVEV